MRIRSFLTIAATLIFAIISIGCGGTATNTTNTTVNTNARPANTTTAANTTITTNTASTSTANTTTASTAPNTGVAECDEYIRKYEACLTKIAAKAPQVEKTMKDAFDAQRKGFQTAASNPQTKSTLSSTCKQAMETAKASTSAYSCDW